MPVHWSSRFSQQARVSTLVAAVTDPLSGQPESKHMPVSLRKWNAAWYAELFVRAEGYAPPATAYWSRITQPGVTHFTLADSSRPDDWMAWLNDYYPMDGKICQFACQGDDAFSLLVWAQSELQLAFYAQPGPLTLIRQTVVSAFMHPPQNARQRLALLAGRAEGEKTPAGAMICSCFGVSETQIVDAVRLGCRSAQQLGSTLKCGTNCGSCIPELKKIIAGQIVVLNG